jgi:hypothetical protein
MTSKHDDLEAIRTIVETLTPFDPKEQERIIRWACEKLELAVPSSKGGAPAAPPITGRSQSSEPGGKKDIKSFVNSKNPKNDKQFATAVAYYFAFEAPEAERKEAIGSEDLQDACRLVDRERLRNPGQTLRNAAYDGLLDRGGERGTYKINTVGENLVAVTLPTQETPPKSRPAKRRSKKPRRTTKSKKPSRKRPSKK